VFGTPAGLVGVLCALAAVLHAARLVMWKPQVTLTRPILWILHGAYAWLPIGFALLAAAQAGWVAEALAVHAFAVGAVGGLIIGMITRTARGHTGRPLKTTRARRWPTPWCCWRPSRGWRCRPCCPPFTRRRWCWPPACGGWPL
jgi:uncharacterized protein involved in response to NO